VAVGKANTRAPYPSSAASTLSAGFPLSSKINEGLSIAVPTAVPLVVTAGLFGDGGWMNMSHADTLGAMTASLIVAPLGDTHAWRNGLVPLSGR
jgi:hypothetical protein